MSNLKLKIGLYNLKIRLKGINRKVKTHNFKTAKTAGILFSSMDNKSFETIKGFISFLSQQDIQVFALGYIPSKNIPENFLMRKGITLYSNNDLNWYFKPKNAGIEKFIETDFDILFDLNTKEYFTTNYVGSLSKASFKIGKQTESSYHDLVFDIKKNNTIEFLIEQIKHYLNILNNN